VPESRNFPPAGAEITAPEPKKKGRKINSSSPAFAQRSITQGFP
jgi:hypothetical protein